MINGNAIEPNSKSLHLESVTVSSLFASYNSLIGGINGLTI